MTDLLTANITAAEGVVNNEEEYRKELALCKAAGADTARLSALKLNAYQLAEIRKGLEAGINVNDLMNPDLPWTEMEELRLEREQGIDMSKYRKEGFDVSQLREIREGIKKGLDVSQYDKKEYFSDQMRQIRLGLEAGLPIIFYQDPQFDWLQMEEIRKGLESGVDVSTYGDAEIPYMKMRVVRRSEEEGFELDSKVIRDYDAGVLEQMRLAFQDGVNLWEYVKKRFDATQLEQIRIALKKHLPDIDKYMLFEIRGESLEEIRIGMEEGLDVSLYANEHYNYQQMKELRLGLEHQVDIRLYSKPLYQPAQMRELRLGLENGVDISKYSSMVHPAREMRAMREWLEAGKQLPDDLSILFLGNREAALKAQTPEELEAWQFLQTTEGRYLYIPEDNMSCYITLPPTGDDGAYTADYVLTLLFKARIRKGLIRKNIEEMIHNKQFGIRVLVAQGKPAVDGDDGYYEYLTGGSSSMDPLIMDDGTADFSDIRFYEDVKLGDKLAVYHRATRGVEGYTVTGQSVRPKMGKEKPILKGTGIMLLNDKVTYVAAIEGVLRIVDGEFRVSKLKKVGSLLAGSDNINFDGSVWVQGDMEEGTSVRASGDVLVDGVMVSGVIRSGGNVLVRGGISGNSLDRSDIDATGMVSTKRIENTKIHCEGDVYTNHMYNAHVVTDQKVVLFGSKGVINGGVVRAVMGVETAVIGSKTVVETIINVGITSEITDGYNELIKDIARVREEIKALMVQKEQVADVHDASNMKMLQLKIKVNAAIGSKDKELKELLEEKEATEERVRQVSDAKVVASRAVLPGSVIDVNGARIRTHEVIESKGGNIVFEKQDKTVRIINGGKVVA